MKTSPRFPSRIAAIAAALLAVAPAQLSAQQTPQPAVRIAEHDLGGVVTGKNGPEAGVWVIAETTGLPTPFAKIVVTDDQGRYLVPDLPPANYDVWVRGYGLVDSPRVVTTPGKTVNLQAVPASNAAAAAQYYPAVYWFSLLNIPDEGQFSGLQRDPTADLLRHNGALYLPEYYDDQGKFAPTKKVLLERQRAARAAN